MRTESEMITLSGHLCKSLHVGHAKRSRLVSNYKITVSGSQDLIHSFILFPDPVLVVPVGHDFTPDLFALKTPSSRQVTIVQWFWVHTPAIRVRFLAGDLLTESVMVTLLWHFCASPHVGHARRRQASIKVHDYCLWKPRSMN